VNAVLDKWSLNEDSEMAHYEKDTAEVSTEEPDVSSLAELSFMQQLYFVMARQLYITVVDPMLYLGRAVMFLVGCTFFAVIYVYSRERQQDQVFNHLWMFTW